MFVCAKNTHSHHQASLGKVQKIKNKKITLLPNNIFLYHHINLAKRPKAWKQNRMVPGPILRMMQKENL